MARGDEEFDGSGAGHAPGQGPPSTLLAFFSGLAMNGGAWLSIVGLFCVFRLRYPHIYLHNKLSRNPLTKINMFGWVRASLDTTVEDVAREVGLDSAMLLEFSSLCMRILLVIGTPMFLIVGPLNWLFGGRFHGVAAINFISVAHVEKGSFLFWIHAFVVWAVVFTVQVSVFRAQRRFLKLRFDWLRDLPELRANTVLVEGIPPEYRSDSATRRFFTQLFPNDQVKAAHVVKDTGMLPDLVEAQKNAAMYLRQAEHEWAMSDNNPEARPTTRTSCWGEKVDSIEYHRKQEQELGQLVAEGRAQVAADAPATGGVNLSRAFVIFNKRQDAEIALRLVGVSHNEEEWVMSTPPEPYDVIWDDFKKDPQTETRRTIAGSLLLFGLWVLYMPITYWVTNIAEAIHFGSLLEPFWQSLAPTVGLEFMVAFLPTFLIMIFRAFFTLKADAWAQHRLQIHYFYFQIVFVLLASEIKDISNFAQSLIHDPKATLMQFEHRLTTETHFYMNFISVQWVTHAVNITRYIVLMKFKIWQSIYHEDEHIARQRAEPEDQDYYGIGSRSARWTIVMLMAIVYSTLCPPIIPLVFINFAICRLLYGYLIPCAETIKPDLGGVFWVSQLRHLFIGTFIYCVLMSGVLCARAATYGPMLVALPSAAYILWSLRRFDTTLLWEKLPLQEIKDIQGPATMGRRRSGVLDVQGHYVQPELCDDIGDARPRAGSS